MKKLVKVFQVRDVDFSILKPIVQSVILTLQTQATTPGPRIAAFLVAVGEDILKTIKYMIPNRNVISLLI